MNISIAINRKTYTYVELEVDMNDTVSCEEKEVQVKAEPQGWYLRAGVAENNPAGPYTEETGSSSEINQDGMNASPETSEEDIQTGN